MENQPKFRETFLQILSNYGYVITAEDFCELGFPYVNIIRPALGMITR